MVAKAKVVSDGALRARQCRDRQRQSKFRELQVRCHDDDREIVRRYVARLNRRRFGGNKPAEGASLEADAR